MYLLYPKNLIFFFLIVIGVTPDVAGLHVASGYATSLLKLFGLFLQLFLDDSSHFIYLI
jgi:hypothetical protein